MIPSPFQKKNYIVRVLLNYIRKKLSSFNFLGIYSYVIFVQYLLDKKQTERYYYITTANYTKKRIAK